MSLPVFPVSEEKQLLWSGEIFCLIPLSLVSLPGILELTSNKGQGFLNIILHEEQDFLYADLTKSVLVMTVVLEEAASFSGLTVEVICMVCRSNDLQKSLSILN